MKCPKCQNKRYFFFYTITSYEVDLDADEYVKNEEDWYHASCGKCGEDVKATKEDVEKFWRG